MEDFDATIPPKRVREPDAPDLEATVPPKRMRETERAIPQDFDPDRTIPNRRMRREMGEFSVGDVIAYRYQVISVLGRGAMGVVYRCFDKVASIEVALKGLPPELAGNDWEFKEIKKNFQLVHKLHHPNIASYNTIELDQTSGGYFLVMEFVDGVELRTYMENNRPDHATIINIIAAIAAALDYAHEQQILHRDIKPGNIMIDRNGIVKILDFGLAAQIHSSMSKVSMVQDSSGTAPYMSPEQWRGRRQNASCDQYALGVVAYEMFAGFLPFESTDMGVLREVVLKETPEPLANVTPSIQYAVNKALGKTPEERFPNCTAFAQALTAPVVTPVAIVSPPPMPVKSKSPLGKIIIATVAALLLLGGGIGIGLWQKDSKTPESPKEEKAVVSKTDNDYPQKDDKVIDTKQPDVTPKVKVIEEQPQLEAKRIADQVRQLKAKGVEFSEDNKTLVKCPKNFEGGIVIPSCVTTIGKKAFDGCRALTTVTIPDSVTTIGDWAFYHCSKLTTVTIPDSVTTIGVGAFSNCTNLTSVTIPDSVTTIGEYAFFRCENLTSVTIPDSVTTIGDRAFFNVQSVKVASGNRHYKIDSHGALLTKDGKKIFYFPPGFSEHYTIPASVTTIGAMAFDGCRKLTTVTIPDSVTTIGDWAFSHCESLTTVTIPDSVTTIGYGAFFGCTKLTSVTIPGDCKVDVGAFPNNCKVVRRK